jgi:polysaccharide deacetylase family protein (PEP-CTERM system associated)
MATLARLLRAVSEFIFPTASTAPAVTAREALPAPAVGRIHPEPGLHRAYAVSMHDIPEAAHRSPAVPLAIQRPTCAFTVDVEDWYQSSMDYDAPISERVVRNVNRVCEMLDECSVRGTFFVQGKVAEAFPRMLQDLLRQGHEIQSHGYSHRPLYAMTRRELDQELERAVRSVEDACGVRVNAFRAPDFSILPGNLWALEVLADHGFDVDSSIFPLRTRRYGVPGWGLEPRHVKLPGGRSIFEVPVAIGHVGPVKIPVAGGGYFRLMPRAVLDSALRSILDAGRPVVIYCHPYEFSPEEMDEYRGKVPALYRMHQSVGRGALAGRFRHLLRELPFGRFDDVIAGWPTV